MILNLGQWLGRCGLKDFLSGAFAALLINGAYLYSILHQLDSAAVDGSLFAIPSIIWWLVFATHFYK